MSKKESFKLSKIFLYRFQNYLMAIVIIATILLGCRLYPHPHLSEGVPLSTIYYDKNGKILRMTTANDDRYRTWTKLEDISPDLINGVKLYEDQWFDYHFGFNPISLVRGAFVSYVLRGHMQGGSTLAMQLARMRWKLNTRSIKGKATQILRAVQLELFYSKDDILEAYFNYAPYGRNIESVGAASLIYFNKKPLDLTLPESLTLAVLPQSPTFRVNKKTGIVGESLTNARNRLFEKWQATYKVDDFQAALFTLPLPLRQPESLPFLAPHFIEQIMAAHYREGYQASEVETTLDDNLQQLMETQIKQFVMRNQKRGIYNAAGLMIDVRDMSVVAMVGSADYFNREIQGQVNGTNAKRSPGSTLKPFIYSLAIDQGLIHPMTVLKDVPTTFSNYSPENFDHIFTGLLTATDALIYSRNIPAVALSSRLKSPNLYQFLRQSGVGSMASESHYGLALALGGGEITMQELAKLYAMLINEGYLYELRFEKREALSDPIQLLSHEASYLTLDMLSKTPLPNDIVAEPSRKLPVYWKTGTSWAFRDAWTAGIVGPYVVVVWVGNFNGKGNPAFVSADSAAPLFLNIVNSLKAQYPNMKEPARPKKKNISEVEICLSSGNIATVWCQRKGKTLFIPGKSPIKVDDVYRPVVIDRQTNQPICSANSSEDTKIEVYEYWSSDIHTLFKQAGLPKRLPPDMSHCYKNNAFGESPKITSPPLKTTYSFRANKKNEQILLSANVDSDVGTIFWFINDSYLGKTKPGQLLPWIPSKSGSYTIKVVDDHGRSNDRRTTVDFLQIQSCENLRS